MRGNVALSVCDSVFTVSVLARPGHALEQAVAAGQQADQHALDHVALADDDLADLGEHVVEERR